MKYIAIFLIFLSHYYYQRELDANEKTFVNRIQQQIKCEISTKCLSDQNQIKCEDGNQNNFKDIFTSHGDQQNSGISYTAKFDNDDKKFDKVIYNIKLHNQYAKKQNFKGKISIQYLLSKQPINDIIKQFAKNFCHQYKQVNFELQDTEKVLKDAFEYAMSDSRQYNEEVVKDFKGSDFKKLDDDTDTSATQKRKEILFQLGDPIYIEDKIQYFIDVNDPKFDSIKLILEKKISDDNENDPIIKFTILSSFYKREYELSYMSQVYLVEKIIECFNIMRVWIYQNLEIINLNYDKPFLGAFPDNYDKDAKDFLNRMVNHLGSKIVKAINNYLGYFTPYNIVKDLANFIISHDDLFDQSINEIDMETFELKQNQSLDDQCEFSVKIQIILNQYKQPQAIQIETKYKPKTNLPGINFQHEQNEIFYQSLSTEFNYFGLQIQLLRDFIKKIATTIYQVDKSKSQKYYGEQVINPYPMNVVKNNEYLQLAEADVDATLNLDVQRIFHKPIQNSLVQLPYNYGLKTVKVVFRQENDSRQTVGSKLII